MTDQEILEAEKLIANMKNELTGLASTKDVEELPDLVLEKMPRVFASFLQLIRFRPSVFESRSHADSVQSGLIVIMAVTEMAQRRSADEKKLVATVAQHVPIIISELDKIAEHLAKTLPVG